MRHLISSSHQHAYLPETSHTQVALCAEVAFPVTLHLHRISPHRHVEHGCEECNAHVHHRFPRAGIACTHGERAGTATIDVNIEHNHVPCIRRSHSSMKCSESRLC